MGCFADYLLGVPNTLLSCSIAAAVGVLWGLKPLLWWSPTELQTT